MTICLAGASSAQDQPLSVIDWVKRNPDQPAMTSTLLPNRFEPPVTPGALVPPVTVKPLGEQTRRIIGLVPAAVTGLPETLWTGSTPKSLVDQLQDMPSLRLPAAQALLYTVLLTETEGPGNDAAGDDLMTLARVDTLMRFGAHDPALALLEQAGITRDARHFASYMNVALLSGQEDTACAILQSQSHLAPSLAQASFCAARQGDWPTAALYFDTGHSLGAITGPEADALERFLHPESFEESAPLERPSEITPLLFRLHEAIGEPMPTGVLPLAYAVADLRDLAGWKSQLEAAERLSVTGALPANRLLGLYTARQPAASGGIWDRVAAVQRFETALRSRSDAAISKSLPPAWKAMQSVGLDLIFADLFTASLARYALADSAAEVSRQMHLLSANYNDLAHDETVPPIQRAILNGKTTDIRTRTPIQAALIDGFDIKNARQDLTMMARNGRMGEAILRALVLLDDGASGDPVALRQALSTLRSFGLEDTIRRAALQVLLLERFG
ncbi:MAG: hypothetical protein ABJG75_10335 [Roseobacter sp.]